MESTNSQSLNNNFQRAKDSKFKAQLVKVYEAFKEKPMTMLEADNYTGVMRSNICYYIDMLLEQERIALIRKRKCSISGYSKVNEYTADPSLFPKSNQLKLF
ncbi:hypothetical protein LZ575_03115 [Antarcticibacterium sp. 1MA-6-2]|uniref:hypothetical protein n=1 Tax=Antarcticibacterium sp. 1MA-6-2 TaxID=2908210 RepID=UPI001F2AF579|nr:hypothetical protein [Antarcticibacterium sp. 1MA-6-2]UJH91692.1 hypothetical protein LZ575_03115 [Antarcticibacterium sp. 1MA-6-2]